MESKREKNVIFSLHRNKMKTDRAWREERENSTPSFEIVMLANVCEIQHLSLFYDI